MRLVNRYISKNTTLGLICAGVSLLGGASARATTITLTATADATLLGGGDATTNNSLGDPGFMVGTDGNKNPKRGLVQFDVADALPAGATINSVTLNLVVGQVAGSAGTPTTLYGPTVNGQTIGYTISLYNEAQAWGAPTNYAGANLFNGHGHGTTPANGDATWNYAAYNSTTALATAWITAGGDWNSSLTDLADMHVASSIFGQTDTWASTPALVAEVQGWLNNPTSNDGFLLKNADETDGTDFLAYWGTQGAANYNASPTYPAYPAAAPQLTIDYSLSSDTSVPEPASVGLLVLGAPLLMGRKHRQRSAARGS